MQHKRPSTIVAVLILLVAAGYVLRPQDPKLRPASPAVQFAETGWKGVQYFESRTYAGAGRTLVARHEGLVDQRRRQAMVRTYGGAGALLSEAVALGRVVVARSATDADWSVAQRSEYRRFLAAASANLSPTLEPAIRVLDPATSPTGWRLDRPNRALQATLDAEHARMLAGALREPARVALGVTLPEPSRQHSMSWRRWWRSGRLVAEERQLTAVPGRRASDDAVEIVQSLVYVEPPDPHLQLTAQATLLGWHEAVDAVHRAIAELRRSDASRTDTSASSTSSGTCRYRLASYTLTRAELVQDQPEHRPPRTAAQSRLAPSGLSAFHLAEAQPHAPEESGVRPIPRPPPPDELDRLPRPRPRPWPDDGARPRPRGSGSTPPASRRVPPAPGAWFPGFADQLGQTYYIATLYDSWGRFGQAVNGKIAEASDAVEGLEVPGAPTPQPAPEAASKRRPSSNENVPRFPREKSPPHRPDPGCDPAELPRWRKVLRERLGYWRTERHHIATLYGIHGAKMRQLLIDAFGRAAPSLDGEWNTMWVEHNGSVRGCPRGHDSRYHHWVIRNMRELIAEAKRGVGRHATPARKFERLWQRMKRAIREMPYITSCHYWKCR